MTIEDGKPYANTVTGEDILGMILLGVILCSMVAAGIYVITHLPATTESEVGTIAPIYSLHDFNTVEGRFFLGSGTIGGVSKYTMYVDANDEGGLKQLQIRADRVTIYRDGGDSPYVVTIQRCKINKKTGEVVGTISVYGYPKYDLHVPSNTIVEEYVLDG